MRRYITLDRMGELLKRGMPLGLRRKGDLAHRWEWAVHGTCHRPVDVQLVARTEYKSNIRNYRVHPVEAKTIMLDMTTRCRKCEACKKAKSAHWRMRSEGEIRLWPRTWLGTLTLSVESHYQMKLRICRHLDKNGIRFEDLDSAEQFQLRCSEIGKEITLFTKRLRTAVGGKLRLLIVAEQHENGLPHFHMLLHECDALAPVRKAMLHSQWRLGFSSWKLVDRENPKAGSYVCKYIAKETLSRIRASQHYGEITIFDERNIFIENNPWEEIRPQKRKALF